MKTRNKRPKRNISLAILNEKCPFCTSYRIWASKTNVGKKCTKCHREIINGSDTNG